MAHELETHGYVFLYLEFNSEKDVEENLPTQLWKLLIGYLENEQHQKARKQNHAIAVVQGKKSFFCT